MMLITTNFDVNINTINYVDLSSINCNVHFITIKCYINKIIINYNDDIIRISEFLLYS